MSIDRSSSGTVVQWPRNFTRWVIPSDAASASSSARRGPSPASTIHSCGAVRRAWARARSCVG